jgi:radical SAM protein with 4Fe4S-binding SPASM domain
MCNSALFGDGVVSTIVQMSPLSLLSARSEKLLQNRAAKPASLRTDMFVDSERPRLRPLQVTWQMTRVSSWKTASARPVKNLPRDTNRVSTAEAFHLIEEVAAMRVPVLALTGGDPLTRPDLFPIIEFAARQSVRTSLTLLPTPLLEPATIAELKACGLLRVGFWLHGSTPALHDSHCGATWLYRRTLAMIGACHEVQLPVQVNTTVSRANFFDLDSMIELLIRLDVVSWNVAFLVPASRDKADAMLSAREHEEVFGKLYTAAKRVHFQIKTTEAPHYRRYLLQQRMRESGGRLREPDVLASAARAGNDALGTVFINDRGEAYPSRFLPLSAGDITRQSLAEVYCQSPLFVSLRDSSRLKGKCGRCFARTVCGGSRARAYVMTGDLFAPDPCCAFEPQARTT